jgi:hypothetical protein
LKAFSDFISNNQRNYLTKEEYRARLTIFKSNYELVQSHNAENKDFKLGINHLSDLSDEEFSKRLGLKSHEVDGDDDDDIFRGEEQQID